MGNDLNDPVRQVTVADLQQLKAELLREIKKITTVQHMLPQRSWLKSHEVRRLLKVSHGTLQHLRDSGKLKFSKVGGIMFYEIGDVHDMMQKNGSGKGEG